MSEGCDQGSTGMRAEMGDGGGCRRKSIVRLPSNVPRWNKMNLVPSGAASPPFTPGMSPYRSHCPPHLFIPGRHKVVPSSLRCGSCEDGRLHLEELVIVLQIPPRCLDHGVTQAKVVGHEGAPGRNGGARYEGMPFTITRRSAS